MGSLRFLLALTVAGGHTASMFGFVHPLDFARYGTFGLMLIRW
jgi:hypothetical protein